MNPDTGFPGATLGFEDVAASALFALFAGELRLYCLADVALTPSDEYLRLPKTAWLALVAGTLVIGAAVWLAVRRPAQLTGGRPGTGQPLLKNPFVRGARS